jgi:protein-S-isoprenylcysteine O-methyltransferase Ste14
VTHAPRGIGSLESWFPPALFGAGLIALGAGLVVQTGMRRLVVALYLVWTLLEIRVTFRRHQDRTGGRDRGSMAPYGLARAAAAGAAILVASPSAWSAWQVAAATAFPLGVWLRLAAIGQLGRFYSHRVRTLADHAIVSTGPYRFIRHPAYAGMILAHAGLVAIFPNPLAGAALVLLLVPAVVHRILVEERTLMEVSGYPDYARGRKRLIPAVW